MEATNGHTVKAFDEDLDELRGLVAELGGRAETSINDAMRALARRDTGAAEDVVERSKKISEVAGEIERRAICLIALRAPMADDLREILAALKISTILERIGNYARNVARRVPLIEGTRSQASAPLLDTLAQTVFEMVRTALDAFVARDPQGADRVCGRAPAVDELYERLFRDSLARMMDDPHSITATTHLLFAGQSLERIGDHAVDLAHMVSFAATGEQQPGRPAGSGDPQIVRI